MADFKEVTEFVDNLLFLILVMSVKVKKIHEITVYRHAAYMAPYIMGLQKARASASSNIEGRIIKGLGNCIVENELYSPETLAHPFILLLALHTYSLASQSLLHSLAQLRII